MSNLLSSRPMITGIDKPVSKLALGTASYGLADKGVWFALLDDFLRFGGTIIDTGRAYGQSEAVIGEWLETRRVRGRVVLVTKCAHGKDALLPAGDFEEVVTRELAQSLSCLRTDYVDLYMLHRDNPVVPVGRIIERMNRELESGTVRAIGASNWTYARVDEANAYTQQHGLNGFAVVSNNLSLAEPAAPFYPRLVSADSAGERWHERTRIPLLSWSSQARGFFTGRFTRETADGLDVSDDSFTRRMLEVYASDDNLERLHRARELGQTKGGFSAVQVALAWLLHKPFPLIAIVGPHTREELALCVGASFLELTTYELSWLNLEGTP